MLMRKAKEIEEAIYKKVIAINDDLPGSCFSYEIDDEDLFDLEGDDELHIDVVVRLTTV